VLEFDPATVTALTLTAPNQPELTLQRLGNPERCVAEEPVLREMASRHQVACHFAEDVDGTAEQVQITGRSGRGASGKTDA